MKPATTTTTTGARSPAVRTVLDVKPGFQPRARYFAALTSNGFVPYVIADLTRQAIAYWQLRRQSAHRTGIEQAFLDAYLSQAACLLLVASECFGSLRRPRSSPRRRVCAPEMLPHRRQPTARLTSDCPTTDR